MSDVFVAAVVVGIVSAVLFDFLFLRWLRRRSGHKYDLHRQDIEPPCWVYGWHDE